jgi:hypothetical protein
MEAAGLLEMSERTFHRWRDRYREPGEADLAVAGRLRRYDERRLPKSSGCWVCIATSHRGFVTKNFQEQPGKRHNLKLTRLWHRTQFSPSYSPAKLAAGLYRYCNGVRRGSPLSG